VKSLIRILTETESGFDAMSQTKFAGGFMKVKVKEVSGGLHPSEVVVQVETTSGPENLVVDRRSFKDDLVEVGAALGRDEKGNWLIELPRETMSGTWRVWVPEKSLVPEARERAA
jgi:hypothetical protein